MRKKSFLLGVTGAFFLTAPAFSTGLSLDTLSEESLPGLVKKYPRIAGPVKDIMRTWPDVLNTAQLGPVASFKALDFEKLEEWFFPKNAWHPHGYQFQQEELQGMFQPYVAQSFLEDKHLIFLANVLYEAGKEVYKENWEDILFLETTAALGHSKAQLEMFRVSYRKNKLEESKNYVFCAAAQGDSEALLELSDLYDLNFGKGVCPQNRPLAKVLCQEAALLQDPEAIFSIEVATHTNGMFGEPRNFQQGVRNAQQLADKGNKRAQIYIDSFYRSSKDALQEGDDTLTEEDFDFLRAFLGWRDTWDEE